MARNTTDIIEALLAEGKLIRPSWSWAPKSPEADLVSVCGSEFARQYLMTDYVKLLTRLDGYIILAQDQTIRDALMETWDLTEVELDAYLENDLDNYMQAITPNITRNVGSKTRGPVLLVFANNTSVSLVQGTKFVSSLRRKKYTTIESMVTRVPVLENGRYVIRVFVECTVIGNDGNIISGSVLQPQTKINNLIRAEIQVNLTNGEDKENNVDFVARIKQARTSKGVGSRSWLRTLLLDDARVYDVYLNAIGDDGFDRPQGIDAWIYAQETPKSVTEVVKESSGYILEAQPLIDENAIITGGYELFKNTDSYQGSVQAVDSATGPAGGSISYYVDDTIRALQLKCEDQDDWLCGGRRLVLVKKAKKIKIVMKIKMYHSFGYDQAIVREDVEQNLQYFFTGGTTSNGIEYERKLLGISIDKSDILKVITETPGVDRVDISMGPNGFTAYRSDGRNIKTDPIPIQFNEFTTSGAITWL